MDLASIDLRALWDGLAGLSPVVLFVAMALLPLVGVPVSPFWVALGARCGVLAGAGLALAGLLVSLACSYWIAHGWLRVRLAGWLERRGYRLPQANTQNETELILMVRLTPAFPFAVQNYLLGVAGVSFRRFMLVSMPIQTAFAVGFLTAGNALSESRVWTFVLAAGGLVALGLLVRMLRRRFGIGAAQPAGTAAAPATSGKPMV
jgi:uncharacterized membrane protein YdjX (TVP38/TMEM64 family)